MTVSGPKGLAALLRIARREVTRHPRRSALIVALIAFPVAVVACGLAIQATLSPSDADLHGQELGRADIVVGEPRPGEGSDDPGPPAPHDPAAVERALRDALPPGSEVVADLRVRLDLVAGDRATGVDVDATDAPRSVNDGRFRLDRGRLPARSGEVALSPAVARELGTAPGDEVVLQPGDVRLDVVGLARATGALRDGTAIVPVGTTPTAAWLVDLPPGVDVERVLASLRDVPALDRIQVRSAGAALQDWGVAPPAGLDPTWFIVGALALAWTGVVAAATFAIGARSRLREVGLVAVAGGTRRQVCRLLLADGLVLGALASVLGLVAGLALAVPAVAWLGRDADRDPGRLHVPLAAELGAVALGTTAALLAARWPAVRAARLPARAALESRITRPPRRVRASVGGVVAIGAGATVLVYGTSVDGEVPIVIGTLLIVAGVAMLNRLLVDLVARLAGRAPLTLRFAARDASRQASRTGPAVVASMLALAAAIGAATITSTAAVRDAADPERRGPYPPHRLEVGVRPPEDAGPTAVVPMDPAVGPVTLEGDLVDALHPRQVGAIWWATPGPPPGGGATGGSEPPPVRVATPEALAVLGVTDEATLAAFARGSVLQVDRGAAPARATVDAADGSERRLPVVEARSGTVGVLGAQTVPPSVAEALGFTAVNELSVIVDLGRPVRDEDLARAHAVALPTAGAGATIWTSTAADCCDKHLVTLAVLGFGLAVALPVLGLVAALTRSEAHGELAVLDAVGIAPRRRRRLSAASMGLLAAFAAALAVPAGLIPATLFLRANSSRITGGSTISVPTSAIAALIVGVPLALAGIGWLIAGRRDVSRSGA